MKEKEGRRRRKEREEEERGGRERYWVSGREFRFFRRGERDFERANVSVYIDMS